MFRLSGTRPALLKRIAAAASVIGLAALGVLHLEAGYPRVSPLDLELDGPGINVDDPCFWVDPADPSQSLIFVTSKGSGLVEAFHLATGALVGTITGFVRPNNCAVSGDLLLTTDRDFGDVKVHALPSFALSRTFGDDLVRPFGIDVYEGADGLRHVYVTEELDASVHVYDLPTGALVRTFPTGFGAGIEPIVVDDLYGRVYVGRGENEAIRGIGVFTLDGTPLGEFAGHVFAGEVEGMAIYACGDTGYLLVSDQRVSVSEFEIFDRVTLQHLGTFLLDDGAGDVTNATDGIDVLQTPVPGHPGGLLAACDGCGDTVPDEMDVVDWERIAAEMGLNVCPSGAPAACGASPCIQRVIASADAFVSRALPAASFGTQAALELENDPPDERSILVRFDVPEMAGMEILDARLRLTVINQSTAASDDGGTLYAVAGEWSEATVTYASRPSPAGDSLGVAGVVAAGDAVEFDVTAVVRGAGRYDFMLRGASANKARYFAREANQSPPTLLVRVRESHGPEISVTRPANGTVIAPGAPLALEATANDAEDGDLSASITWTSAQDGFLGRGAALTVGDLSSGAHVITAAVSDGNGLTAIATVSILVNAPPVVHIESPLPGVEIPPGTPVVLMASAIDAEDGDLGAQVTWSSNLDGDLGTGAPLTVTHLRHGTHVLTARVRDRHDAEISASVDILVNTPPAIRILAPADGVEIDPAAPLALLGSAIDDEDGDLTASIAWQSDRDGALGVGGEVTVALRSGSHGISATVVDRLGRHASASVHVVVNAPPAITILAPVDGITVLTTDFPVTLVGSASDLEDGSLDGEIRWQSDRDGVLGVGPRIDVRPSVGAHVIAAEVNDAGGKLARRQIALVVARPNRPPVLDITAPADGAIALAGVGIVFAATAADPEDGDLGDSIRWHSDRAGDLGSGGKITVALDEGTHVLTASVRDAHDSPAVAMRTVHVRAGERSVPADADTYVDASTPGVALGHETTFRVDASPRREAFLRFTLSNVAPLRVERAVLRLIAGTDTAHASVAGGILHAISNTSWDEATTTYSNRPAVDGPVLASRGAVAAGAVVEFDVTRAIARDGIYAFALLTPSGDAAGYHSREAATGTPELRVSLAVNTAPVVEISAPRDGTIVRAGEAVTLVGSAIDAEDGDLGAAVEWNSDRDGILGIGSPLTVALSPGAHRVTAVVSDREGVTAADVRHLHVLSPPRIEILTPADGAVVLTADLPLVLTGAAGDAEDGGLDDAIAWASDRDGALGTGAVVPVHLSTGAHVITATVTDADGLVTSARISIAVRTPNAMPAVVIHLPTDGAATLAGKAVVLAASATDLEDGDLGARLAWVSSLDGALGVGARLDVAGLSPGTHQLIASVTDAGGVSGSARIALTVRPATMMLTAVADTYVDAGAPSTPHGSEIVIKADASPRRDALLRFVVADVAPFAIDRAVLRLVAGPESTHASASGGTVHAFGDVRWLEATTTYANRPAIDGPALATTGGVVTGTTVEFDVTAAVTTAGPKSFAVVTASSDAVGYRSREATSGSPVLVLTLRQSTAPVVHITTPAAGAVVRADYPVTLAATAVDAEDGDLAARVDWHSDVDGLLGTGARLTAMLSPGPHHLVATVTDADGRGGEATVEVVVDAPPTVTIVAPPGGIVSGPDTALALAGVAIDPEDGDLGGAIVWKSNLDGHLGTGSGITVAGLSSGLHEISASVADRAGNVAVVTVALVIDTPPVVAIEMPAPGAAVLEGVPVSFAGRALDAAEGELGDALVWTSDLAGSLGTGRTLAGVRLGAGTHLVTATATDSRGLAGAATVVLTVMPARTLQFATVADAFVVETAPDSRFGASAQLIVNEGAPRMEAYLKFDVAGLSALGAARTVLLRLTVDGAASAGGGGGGAVYALTETAWEELRVTYRTRPIVTGAPLATIGAVQPGVVVEVDVSAAVAGDGMYAFALIGTVADAVVYRSREASAGRPELVVRAPADSSNRSPEITISGPDDGATVSAGMPVRLSATASDPEDGSLDVAIVWRSDRDGALGGGPSLSVAGLTPGPHVIRAAVMDGAGATAAASIGLVVDAVPTLSIIEPRPAAMVPDGTVIRFTGAALDEEDGDLGSRIAWISSRDGALGTGVTLTTALSVGSHVVRAEVRDHRGGTAMATVSIQVLDDMPPVVTIEAPGAGLTVAEGDAVVFVGRAVDAADGELGDALVWTSDLAGPLGTGGTLAGVRLGMGRHVVTATATDSQGFSGTATVLVTVAPVRTLRFGAVADAFVVETAPDSRFGASAQLIVNDGAPRMEAYIKFEATGLSGFGVARAVLRLTVDGAASAGSSAGGAVYALADTGWEELWVTYRTRPAVTGPPLATVGAVRPGDVVEVDVGAALAGDGIYAFALVGTVADAVVYRSREAASGRAELVVTLR